MNSMRTTIITTILFLSVFAMSPLAQPSDDSQHQQGKGEISMNHQRINLQNTPDPAGVSRRDVTFDSNGVTLKGTLSTPQDSTLPLPGAIVAGAWTTVKEQMSGTYARELAARGFAALAFDFTGWGGSGGDIRYLEDPAAKTADIMAAATFMAGLEQVDEKRITVSIWRSSFQYISRRARTDH